MSIPAPVEYTAAVERFLGQAALGPASRRVYRISLASWSWPLAGRPAPRGTRRRGAAPPFVPLARLDDPGTGPVLAAALRDRAAGTDVRTVNRELSALRSAVAWWQDQRWISRDPTEGLRHVAGPPPPQPVLTPGQLTRLFQVAPSLREHALWRVLHGPVDQVGYGQHRTTALADRGPPGGPGLPDQPPRPGGDPQGGRVPAHRAGPAVLPARRRGVHRGHQAARPGGGRLDPHPTPPGGPPVRPQFMIRGQFLVQS